MRISNSFSEGEIQVLDFILTTLLRGGTPTMATRHKEFASLCRKVQSMKSRIVVVPAAAPTETAVGTVAAPSGTADATDDDLQNVG